MKTTVNLLCVRVEIARQEIAVEAQKLLSLYNDPTITPEKKEQVRKELDAAIERLESKVETSRQIRRDGQEG